MPSVACAGLDPAEGICATCGLCCNGAIFDWFKVSPEEIEQLPSADLAAASLEGGAGLGQPCPMLKGTLCSAYAVRPKRCRSFECNVLAGARSGRLGGDEAAGLVKAARRLVDDLRPLLEPGETLPAARRRWARWFAAPGAPAPSSPPPAARAEFVVRMTLLNRFLDRHFRKDSKKQTMELDRG